MLLAFRGASAGLAVASDAVLRGKSLSWREARVVACGGARRSAGAGRDGSADACVLASTSVAKPFGCDGASGAGSRVGSDRAGDVALDSDVTLNTGTSAHETEISPARNRPTGAKRKNFIDQLHIKPAKPFVGILSRWFLPSGKICRPLPATA